MSALLFPKAKDRANTTGLLWTTDAQKAALFDPTQAATWTKQVSNVTNANPAVYTTTTAHGFVMGDVVLVGGVLGNLSANQLGRVSVATSNTFQLVTLDGAGSNVAGSGAYATGGWAVNLSQPTFVSDVVQGNGRAGADVALTGEATSGGVATATSWTWVTVSPGYAGQQAWAFLVYDGAGGTDATNRLLLLNDGKIRVVCNTTAVTSATSVLVEPLRGGIPINTLLAFSNGQLATLSVAAMIGDRLLTVSALSGSVPLGATAEAVVTAAGLPLTPNGGNVNFTAGQIYAPGLPVGIFIP